MPTDKCNAEHDGHVCDKDAGHRSWHKDTREWSPTRGGATYEWISADKYKRAPVDW